MNSKMTPKNYIKRAFVIFSGVLFCNGFRPQIADETEQTPATTIEGDNNKSPKYSPTRLDLSLLSLINLGHAKLGSQ